MYSLNNCNKYYLYQGYARMSLGIDGLYRLVRSEMKGLSPISGDAFIFFGKARKSVKILKWDGDGFLLFYKRLERGSFELPVFNPHTGNYEISRRTLSFILDGVSLKSVRMRKRFKCNFLKISILGTKNQRIYLVIPLVFRILAL